MDTGLLTAGSCLKLHDYELPSLPIVSATTEPLPDPFADLHASSLVMAGAEQDAQAPTSWDGTDEPLPEPETANNNVGSFDTFYFNEDLLTEPTESTVIAETEVPPSPQPQIRDPPQISAAATLGLPQEAPLVLPASDDDSSTPEMAAERLLAGAMPHYESGMQGLNRFLRLVNRDGKKKC